MGNKEKIKNAEDVVQEFLEYISHEHGISRQEITQLLRKPQQEIMIPIEVVSERRLGCMEAAVKYLRENKRLTYQQISELTGRSRSTIGVMYHNSKRKLREQFPDYPADTNSIPIGQLKNQKFSALESVVSFLLARNLRVCQIAELLKRDYRTVYTVYRRGMVKNETQ